MAFPVLISMQLRNVQEHDVQLSHTDSYPIWTINVESALRNLFIALSNVQLCTSPILTNLQLLNRHVENRAKCYICL